jgi:hypothetical protein
VSRGLLPVYPYTASTTYQKAHPGGSVLIISNSPQVYNEFTAKRNAETISGAWTFNGNASFTYPTTFSSTTRSSATPSVATDVVNVAYATSTFVGLSGNQTVTGVKTFSSAPIGPTCSGDTELCPKAYIDTTVAAGVPIANETTTGAGRKATSAQIAAGFASTTPYFIPSSLASSTASSTSIVVVTRTDTGKIDNTFLKDNFTTATTTTLSVTTLANQRIIVWAKGWCNDSSAGVATLTYNVTEKDRVELSPSTSGNKSPFSLMYTEIPGAGTQNITLACDAGSVNAPVIIAEII